MGIIKKASDDFATDFADFKAAGSPTRAQRRKYVASIVNAGQEWLSKFDAQENAASADFAATKTAQYQTFTDALADPALNPVDPQS